MEANAAASMAIAEPRTPIAVKAASHSASAMIMALNVTLVIHALAANAAASMAIVARQTPIADQAASRSVVLEMEASNDLEGSMLRNVKRYSRRRQSLVATLKLSLSFLLLGIASGLAVNAQSKAPATRCEAPSAAINVSVNEYVIKKYHLSSASQLTLLDSGATNQECYWTYHFQAGPQRTVTLYLAPDHRYLSTTLYDRMEDPLVEENRQREEIARSLLAIPSPSLGPEKTPVTIVEFSDFECPFCQRLTNTLEKDVLPQEKDVRVVFKNFQLSMHPWARPAAQLVACGGLQSNDAFWSLHDYVFSNQKQLTVTNAEPQIIAFADQQSNIDHKLFHDCVDRGLTVGLVMKDEELGHKNGVSATPTLFINGSRVNGAQDAAQLKRLIDAARTGNLALDAAAGPTASPTGTPGVSCLPTPQRGGR
jgi:protein-disulfide isomerase